jgi:hypothetical protein
MDSGESGSDKETVSPEWALLGDAQYHSLSRSKEKVDAGKSLRGCERRSAQSW